MPLEGTAQIAEVLCPSAYLVIGLLDRAVSALAFIAAIVLDTFSILFRTENRLANRDRLLRFTLSLIILYRKYNSHPRPITSPMFSA